MGGVAPYTVYAQKRWKEASNTLCLASAEQQSQQVVPLRPNGILYKLFLWLSLLLSQRFLEISGVWQAHPNE